MKQERQKNHDCPQPDRCYVFLVSYVEERPRWPEKSPNKETKKESEMLREERDQMKFIDLRFERWQVVRFRKARRRQDVP